MKDSLRRIRFQSTEELKEASVSYLKGLLKKDFEEVFQDWERHMQKCVDARGNYFLGHKVCKLMKINGVSADIFSLLIEHTSYYIIMLFYSLSHSCHVSAVQWAFLPRSTSSRYIMLPYISCEAGHMVSLQQNNP